ncbi:DUF6596 domain-containing protein [Klenkia terrae]|uniref:DUF6596 domain-containing protein n=1 Tax=Klenkia terrae TaxID=1052259 RepID=UPI00360D4835
MIDDVRALVPQVIGVLVRRGADFAMAEDAVQEALVEALRVWPADPPREPRAWLVTVAWRRFLDATRSDVARRRREEAVAEQEPEPGPVPGTDDTLQLYALCAHPSLSPSAAVALTLRAVGGLTTRQIAAAYLVPEATMAQRISRAKRTVAGVRLDRPGDVGVVLRVLYLVFNEGYSGDVDLAAEAIRLTRQLRAAVDHPEVAGLLALMLLHHARRGARTAPTAAWCRWPGRTAAAGTGTWSPRAPASCRPRWPGTGWASTRRRPRWPPCTPTPRRPRRPTGCRWSSGTTSCCGSPRGARSSR